MIVDLRGFRVAQNQFLKLFGYKYSEAPKMLEILLSLVSFNQKDESDQALRKFVYLCRNDCEYSDELAIKGIRTLRPTLSLLLDFFKMIMDKKILLLAVAYCDIENSSFEDFNSLYQRAQLREFTNEEMNQIKSLEAKYLQKTLT